VKKREGGAFDSENKLTTIIVGRDQQFFPCEKKTQGGNGDTGGKGLLASIVLISGGYIREIQKKKNRVGRGWDRKNKGRACNPFRWSEKRRQKEVEENGVEGEERNIS